MVTCRPIRKNFGHWFLLCGQCGNHMVTRKCISVGFYIHQNWCKVCGDESDSRSDELDENPMEFFFK